MTRIEVIIPKNRIFDDKMFSRLQAANVLAAALAVKRDFDKTTRSWTHTVTFSIEHSKDSITVSTDDDIYRLVDSGSPSHTIFPKNASRLRFQKGYRAKTTPGVIGSKSGGKRGEIVTARSVSHPGFSARKFVDAIKRKHDPDFFEAGDSAVAAANR